MCTRCGLVYVWPHMVQDELDEFYRNEYRNVYKTSITQRTHRNHAMNAYGVIKDLSGRHLDIGCSTGELLKLTGGRGLEPNREHYEVARAAGLDVINCTIEEYEGEQYDIVTLLNTLEHVTEPSKVLAKVRELMTDNGVLLVTVPNLLSMHVTIPVDAFLSNAHLYNFTPLTLVQMMGKVGLFSEQIRAIPERIGEKLYALARKCEPQEAQYACPEKQIKATRLFLQHVDIAYDIKTYLMGG